jgi:hypothetical protein
VKNSKIDHLFLDTTYLDPRYNFPSQESVVDLIAFIVKEMRLGHSIQSICDPNQKTLETWNNREPKRVLVVVGTYLIGKEKVFTRLAKALETKFFAENRKRRIYKCLNDPELDSLMTNDPKKAQVHVVPMNHLNLERLSVLLNKQQEQIEILAIRPTGWAHSTGKETINASLLSPKYLSKNITLVEIPYSEHSSYNELRDFVQTISAIKIVPTVNVGQKAKREFMERILSEWK